MVLVVLAAIWAGVLVPPYLQKRRRATHPSSSVVDFHQQLAVLQRTGRALDGAELHEGYAPGRPVRPRCRRTRHVRRSRPALPRHDVLRRRRDVLATLASAPPASPSCSPSPSAAASGSSSSSSTPPCSATWRCCSRSSSSASWSRARDNVRYMPPPAVGHAAGPAAPLGQLSRPDRPAGPAVTADRRPARRHRRRHPRPTSAAPTGPAKQALPACRQAIRHAGLAIRAVHRRDPVAHRRELAARARRTCAGPRHAVADHPAGRPRRIPPRRREGIRRGAPHRRPGDGEAIPSRTDRARRRWPPLDAGPGRGGQRAASQRARPAPCTTTSTPPPSCWPPWTTPTTCSPPSTSPDALTGGLRRSVDSLRAVTERTRGDVTTTVLQARLRRALEAARGHPVRSRPGD